MAFTLPDLEFAYDALEPHFDARTMEIHHTKHHAAYVDKGNAAIEGTSLAEVTCPWQACARLSELPADKQTAARNNIGGHANHSLFWSILGRGKGGMPSGELASAIDRDFGSFDAFKKTFADAAATRFGSGWAWLGVKDGKLCVSSTANQDNPVMGALIGDAAGCDCRPILGLDVWEHAYYLHYQNRRPDYIEAFWNVVNWDAVAAHLSAATASAHG
jgi:Fe-Mn family superoxide dismutase